MSISMASIFMLAAAAGLAGAGLMQAAEQAKFHLPVAAHWGSVVLQPGDYNLWLPDVAAGERMFRIERDGKTVRELPLVTDVQKTSESSYLELRQIDGDYFVRELSFGPTGRAFTFSVPKTRQRLG